MISFSHQSTFSCGSKHSADCSNGKNVCYAVKVENSACLWESHMRNYTAQTINIWVRYNTLAAAVCSDDKCNY